ncbi:hypothetical protein NQ314_009260 [Rhamnusium bicolor]|uniref:C2H2-type domain-containing protein n=1 Tax=Rhamnusium bicolor TaxID=1586634 RepID=A0AAV8Y2Q0_9CUCU|nr:hypothetical protein NQ314_009260 [Rhamnusium bicolor]
MSYRLMEERKKVLVKKKKEESDPEIDEKTSKLINLLKITDPLKCRFCTKIYSNHDDLALHSKVHSKDRHYLCHLCDFKVNSKFRIQRHIRGHSGYKCQVCNKTFKRGTSALKHSYTHSGEKPYQCEICGKHLANAKSLFTHLNTIHHEIITGKPLVKYDCVVCKKHYESETGLRRHYSSKHKELGVDLSVICEICGKRISSNTRLKRHIRTHTGQKPYPCLVCTRSFATKCLLTSHMRVHTGEKPFVCMYCGKRFGQSAPYRYHVKIHTDPKMGVSPKKEQRKKLLKKLFSEIEKQNKIINIFDIKETMECKTATIHATCVIKECIKRITFKDTLCPITVLNVKYVTKFLRGDLQLCTTPIVGKNYSSVKFAENIWVLRGA